MKGENKMSFEMQLMLEGKEEDIQRFVEQAKETYRDGDDTTETDFAFQKFIPVPEEIESNEVDWRKKNWGTWLNIDAIYDEKNKKYEIYFYDDGEEPPIQGLLTISKQYPGIAFTLEYQDYIFETRKLAMFGRIKFHNGEMRREEERKVQVIPCSHCTQPMEYMEIDN